MYHDINDYLNQIWSPNFLGSMTRKEREEFILYSATIIDHIWWAKNEKCHKETYISLEESVQTAKRRFDELNQAFRNMENTEGRNQVAPVPVGWLSLSRGVIKINSDAALRGYCSFMGIVARNEDGDAI